MTAPVSNSASQTEREAAGRTGTLPGKVLVLPGVRIAADDGAVPVAPAERAPSGRDVAKVAAAGLGCAVLAGWVAVAAVNSPVLAGVVAVPFAGVVAWEAWRWRRGRPR